MSTFQAPPPTLVSRLMRNFAASWKTEPGWEHQNTPPLKCKMSIHTLELLSPGSWTCIVAHISYCFAMHLWGSPFFFLISSGTFCAGCKSSDHLCVHMCSKQFTSSRGSPTVFRASRLISSSNKTIWVYTYSFKNPVAALIVLLEIQRTEAADQLHTAADVPKTHHSTGCLGLRWWRARECSSSQGST